MIKKCFIYDDATSWPQSADGAGPSLALRHPQNRPDPSLSSNWLASSISHGSPGADDPGSFATWVISKSLPLDQALDTDQDGLTNYTEYTLGTNPTVPNAAPNLILAPQAESVQIDFIRSANAPEARIRLQTSEDLTAWTFDAELVDILQLGPNLQETWTSPFSPANTPRFFIRAMVD